MSVDSAPAAHSAARPPASRRVGLLWTLLLVMVVTALAPLFLTAWKLIDINRESLESASREYQLEVAAGIVQDINATVAGARNQLSAIARVLESKLATGSDAALTSEILAPHLAGDIVLLRYSPRAGRQLEVGEQSLLASKPLSDAILSALMSAVQGEMFVSRPVAAARNGAPCVIEGVPVRSGRGVHGVLAAVVDLGASWERSVGTLGGQYIIFALDDATGLFAEAGMPAAMKQADAWRRTEIVTRFRHEGAGVMEIMPFEAPPGMETQQLLGARASTDRGWGIFVLVDRNLAYASVAEMKRSVYQWALFAVSLAVICAVFFAGAITRPLKALVARARRIASGDFAARADVTSRNELGELAETFNFMAEEIRSYIDKIKAAAEENSQMFMGTIKALAAAIDEKDPYTRGHSERVYRYAIAIARHLNLSRQEMRNVTVGALLHDIGKIGIEDAILRKPASLSDKEFEIMKRHPLKGYNILSTMPQMQEIIPAMRNHHERWSGGGYPDNLKGEEIPMLARIVQVADTFDAMTTNRPYQRAMRWDAAVARIIELSGIAFDPAVVAAFKAAWYAGELRPELAEPAAEQKPPAVTLPARSAAAE